MTTRKKPTDAQKADLIGRVKPYVRHAETKTTPASKPARAPGKGLTPTGQLARQKQGGRQAGSRNKREVSEQFLNDLVWCYSKLGGRDWLLEYARTNPADFLRQGLSRLFPTPYTEPPDVPPPAPSNIYLNDPNALRGAALQIAFALRQGVELMEPERTIEHEPVTAAPPPEPDPPAPPPYQPEAAAPIESFESLQEQAEHAAARQVIANTLDCTISNYPGSSGEQGRQCRKR